MRLLAGMSAFMDGESAGLDEALTAAGPVATVVPRACVGVVMSCQIGLPAETLRVAQSVKHMELRVKAEAQA